MTEKQARKLLKNTVVMFDNDPSYPGIVIEHLRNGSGVLIDWRDGGICGVSYQDFDKIELWQPDERKKK